MVSPVSSISADAVFYAKYDATNLKWTGTLLSRDMLIVDSDNFIAQRMVGTTGAMENAMSGISGTPIFLKPGDNYIKLLDKRYGFGDPEIQSAGTLDVAISYRERYL